jgi:hypothetical protein
MRFPRFFAVFVLAAASCFAADVDGKWAGTFNTPNGDIPVGFNLKADGAALSGTTTGPEGAELKIANGKVDGDKITFSVTIDFGGQAMVLNYSGVVSKDQIKFTIDVMGMPLDMTVKRA